MATIVRLSTESTVVSEVNRITAADSSQIVATKMKHRVAITAERSHAWLWKTAAP